MQTTEGLRRNYTRTTPRKFKQN